MSQINMTPCTLPLETPPQPPVSRGRVHGHIYLFKKKNPSSLGHTHLGFKSRSRYLEHKADSTDTVHHCLV